MFEQIKVPSLRLTHSSEGMRKLKVCGWNRRRLKGAGAKVQPQGDAFDLATIPRPTRVQEVRPPTGVPIICVELQHTQCF